MKQVMWSYLHGKELGSNKPTFSSKRFLATPVEEEIKDILEQYSRYNGEVSTMLYRLFFRIQLNTIKNPLGNI